MRVIESEAIRNFEKVIPEVQPAREHSQEGKITISGLRHIMMLLR